MVTVNLTWSASPADEQVSGYNVYQDGTLAGVATSPSFSIPSVTPGVHNYEVAAVNVWGEGPHSDPVATPPVCGKIVSVSITITVS